MEKNELTDSKRKYSSTIKDISVAIFFIILSICVFDITTTVNNTLISLDNTVKINSTQLTNEVQSLRRDTFRYLNSTTAKLDRRINSIETNIFSRVDSIETNIFSRVDSIEKNTLTSVKNIEDELILLSKEYRTIPQGTQQLFSRFETQTNCNVNDYCWQNLTSDLLIDTRNTVRETSKTFQTEIPKITKDVSQVTNIFNNKFPIIVDNTTRITNNAQKITENIDRLTKPKWYDRVIGWGVNGSMVYFNLRKFR